MPRALAPCTICKEPTAGRCTNAQCRRSRRPADQRPTAAQRGYDRKWRRNSAAFLKANPICVDWPAPRCRQQATVPDHDPHTRAELIAMGEPHPDAWRWLKPRCGPCHSRKTASQDGGFGNPRR